MQSKKDLSERDICTKYITPAIEAAGFQDVEILNSYNVFKDARVAKSAAKFGAKGFNILGIRS